MWLATDGDVLGSYIPPAAFESAGTVPGRRARDEEHGGVRHRYRAEVDEVPGLLAQGWTPDDPAILDELGLRGVTE